MQMSTPNKQKYILESSLTEDGVNKVVLRYFMNQFVTHIENVKCGGFSYGNYFAHSENSFKEAIKNFLERCEKYKVSPIYIS